LRPTLAFLAFALLPTLVSAQTATLNPFDPGETPEDDFHLSRPTDLGHLRFGAQLHLDYGNDPLVWESDAGDRDSEAASVIGHQLDATVGLSLGLVDRVVVYAGLPVTLLMNGDDEQALRDAGINDPVLADGAGLGDIYLGARARLYGEADDAFAVGLQATVTFPTAGDAHFRGEEFLTVHPELLLEARPGGGARVVLDLGARIRENTDAASTNLGFGDELTFGLGFAIPVYTDDEDPRTHLDAHAQIYGATRFDDFFARSATPLEATLGAKLHHASGVRAGLALGPGLTRGFGSPDVRVIGMVGWATPTARDGAPGDRDGDGLNDDVDECPDEPEDVDTWQDEDGCPDPDNDSDAILDVDDECPLEPENVNEHEDEDGCPDEAPPVDSDGDGLLDDVDECPNDPEDADGFEDEDGCPDPDNDEDTILDVDDECPLEPEDRDGFEDDNGCPDPDNDGDTVLDTEDNCPLEPGSPENQGCRRRQRVRIVGDSLEILEKVYFATNSDRIQRRSFRLLANVAEVLNNHPEIARVRVEGHTDARGSRDHNMDLSQRRAESVVRHLVERGEVDEGRLQANGFGPDRPIVEDASSRAEHAQNRRVEFHIVGDHDGIEHQDNGPTAETID